MEVAYISHVDDSLWVFDNDIQRAIWGLAIINYTEICVCEAYLVGWALFYDWPGIGSEVFSQDEDNFFRWLFGQILFLP